MSDDLIRRLQEADEGSRELSDEVLRALGWIDEEIFEAGYFPGSMVWTDPDGYPRRPPDPTRDLNDAVALIPTKEWSFNILGTYQEALIFRAGDGVIGRGNATTPSLSLSIAILKARQKEE